MKNKTNNIGPKAGDFYLLTNDFHGYKQQIVYIVKVTDIVYYQTFCDSNPKYIDVARKYYFDDYSQVLKDEIFFKKIPLKD